MLVIPSLTTKNLVVQCWVSDEKTQTWQGSFILKYKAYFRCFLRWAWQNTQCPTQKSSSFLPHWQTSSTTESMRNLMHAQIYYRSKLLGHLPRFCHSQNTGSTYSLPTLKPRLPQPKAMVSPRSISTAFVFTLVVVFVHQGHSAVVPQWTWWVKMRFYRVQMQIVLSSSV